MPRPPRRSASRSRTRSPCKSPRSCSNDRLARGAVGRIGMVHRTWFVFAALAIAVMLPARGVGGRPLDQLRTAALASSLSNVTRVEITRREPLAGGMTFGSTGSYEKLVGTAFLEVDPADPRNALIVDLDKVPRNARGMVEYSTDLYILKPVDMRMGNGKIFFQVNNRGNKGTLGQ